MRHGKLEKSTDTYIRKSKDYYDYGEFDDDYLHDLMEEKNNSLTKRHRPPRKNARHARAFDNYGKDY